MCCDLLLSNCNCLTAHFHFPLSLIDIIGVGVRKDREDPRVWQSEPMSERTLHCVRHQCPDTTQVLDHSLPLYRGPRQQIADRTKNSYLKYTSALASNEATYTALLLTAATA